MNLNVVTPPPAEPVTLLQVYDKLRLIITDHDNVPPTHFHDDLLSDHIASAREDAEQITRRAFVEQTLRLSGPGFYGRYFDYNWNRYRTYDYRCGIELLRPPLISVLSVQYYDADNVLQTVDADDYYVVDDIVPRLRFNDGYSVPTCYGRSDALRVDYVAGYPPEGSPPDDYAANVPAQIKQAILLGVELLYDSPEPKEREAIERARDSLLSGFVVHVVV